ncbi:MAG: GTPase [Deferribacterales bacterium]
MLPWLIGAVVVTAIVKAVSDDSSSTTTYTSSDEDERREEAIAEERQNMQEKAEKSLADKIDRSYKKLQDALKENPIGTLVVNKRLLNPAGRSYGRLPGVLGYSIGSTLGGLNSAQSASGDYFEFSPSKMSREDKALKSKIKKKVNAIERLLSGYIEPILSNQASFCSSNSFEEYKIEMQGIVDESDLNDFELFFNEISECRPRILASGLLKAGKSTLMNCLTGDYDDTRFKTGVVRETISNQIYEQDGYIFVDTPGVDAEENDTKTAVEAFKTADVVLFVHNVRSGGLDEPERKFMEEVHKNWSNPHDFIKKTIFVLTHMEGNDDYEIVVNEIKKQVSDIYGIEPSVIPVASHSYQKGMKEEKRLLVKKSNYTALHSLISEKQEESMQSKNERYKDKLLSKAEEIRTKLTEQQKELVMKIVAIDKKRHDAENDFLTLLQAENKKIQRAYNTYKDKMDETYE